MLQTNISQITVDEVQKAINEKIDVVILDVRTPAEYSRGKIEGSINIPVDDIASQITTAIPNKNKTVYVYCLSGSRSDVAVEIMIQLGYTNVFSMTSGLLMWRSKKYPMVA
ncbi:MAG: rhodanese-like domain-containing protein [Patescibacteria group bacterium]|jgi:rhodanese-related sulfurtransferase